MRLLFHRAAVVAAALSLGCSDSDVVYSPGPPVVETSLEGVLDFSAAEVAPSFEARVIPLPEAGWAVSSGTFGGFVQRFDGEGGLAGQLGSEGGGPGEFSGPVFGQSVADELLIVDPGSGRVSRFDAEGQFLGSRSLAGQVSSVAPDRARPGLVLSGFFGEGLSLLRAGRDPESDVSGGEIPSAEGPSRQAAGRQWQFATMPSDEAVWTVSRGDGVVRIHDLELEAIERSELPDPAEFVWENSIPEGAFPPESSGILSENGTVWVLTGVPDSDWHPEMNPREVGVHGWGDTFVFAIDVSTREVVATHRMDRICFPAYSSVISCVDEVGQRIELLRLSLGSGDT